MRVFHNSHKYRSMPWYLWKTPVVDKKKVIICFRFLIFSDFTFVVVIRGDQARACGLPPVRV